jgi:hypothetical protein
MGVAIPTDWPVASRAQVAVAKLMVVDRRDEDVLVCDCLHDGPHFWPEDEPAPPIWDAELDESLAEQPGDDTMPTSDEPPAQLAPDDA